MEGFTGNLGGVGGDSGGGDIHIYSNNNNTNNAPPPKYPISANNNNQSYLPHHTSQTDIGPAPVLSAPGPSLPDDPTSMMTGGGGGGGTGGGRRKKKKHKSGDDATAKSNLMSEEELVDAVIPILSENQGVEELTLPSTLPPPGDTLLAGHYLLNNTLLDHILTEKKMQILQSPEVIEYLKKQMDKK
ncbi:hypothetical protein Pcinc_031043 [Petrolisthes cinctipes]|uniref:Uncharacterized protein n=1 Tax=Petrolisthes cinctipes TaxID=88211 RepID=A0AAE1EWW0_PETCI|nr:hypothetical protein Pcinc_031043 [Petrolisthes cinctipes]